MRASRALPVLGAAVAVAVLALSGGSGSDPVTPRGLPGLPPPLLGVALIGDGGRAGAVDAYGDLVDLRAPGPAGRALLEVPAARLEAGSAPIDAARLARARLRGREVPFWRADSVAQRYRPGTNTVVTLARFGDRRFVSVRRIGGWVAELRQRRWLAASRPLGGGAPRWARRLYRRSLLVLRALTDRRSGAVVAGAREGWAYVWPRDAAAAALALAGAGHRADARRIAGFLGGLDLGAAARFDGEGRPVPGRGAQGDAAGWVAAAESAAGLSPPHRAATWRDRSDYQEKGPGDYLGNALAARFASRSRTHSAAHSPADGTIGHAMRDQSSRRREFGAPQLQFVHGGVLTRRAADPDSGIDTAAAWAIEPFPDPALLAPARRNLFAVAAGAGRYGLLPSADWDGGADPWTAPTAWCAWSLATLSRRDGARGSSHLAARERGAALRLVGALHRAATPLGLLPERVDAGSGAPRSTTPLAWSHAFAILALRELWP